MVLIREGEHYSWYLFSEASLRCFLDCVVCLEMKLISVCTCSSFKINLD